MKQFARQSKVVLAFALVAAVQPAASVLKPLWSISDEDNNALLSNPQHVVVGGNTTWIADGERKQLLHIDEKGHLIAAVGRSGAGPGEYQQIDWLGVGANDSLYVWDGLQRRVTVLSSTGKYLRSELLTTGGSQPAIFGRMRDGSWLIASLSYDRSENSGILHDSLIIQSARTLGSSARRMFAVAARPKILIHVGDRRPRSELPMFPMVGVTGCDNGVVVWSGADRNIRAYDSRGSLMKTVTLKAAPIVVTASNRADGISSFLQVYPPDFRAVARKRFDEVQSGPTTIPPKFLIGRDGRIWLLPYAKPYSWTIVSADGTNRVAVPLPAEFDAREIGEDYVVGMQYSDSGATSVQRFLLPANLRTAGGAPNLLDAGLGRCGAGAIM